MRNILALASLSALARAQDVTYCNWPPQSGWPLCDETLSNDARAADAVQRMTIGDKFLALATNTKPLASLNMSRYYNWWAEGAHGISRISYSPTLPGASNTALPITTSCSFNRTLWKATGNQIGREGRAFQNAGQAGSTYWAPCVPRRSARAVRRRPSQSLPAHRAPPTLQPPPLLSSPQGHQHRARPALGPQHRVWCVQQRSELVASAARHLFYPFIFPPSAQPARTRLSRARTRQTLCRALSTPRRRRTRCRRARAASTLWPMVIIPCLFGPLAFFFLTSTNPLLAFRARRLERHGPQPH